MKYYTGVGSRKTPANILEIMAKLADKLKADGYFLRSGGADGADKAFEAGAALVCKIYRPEHATTAAMDLAARFHPAWNWCTRTAQQLHGRNAFQVLGSDLNTPSSFVVCWTRDGAISHSERSRETGGTGTAISIADHYGIPVFNLQRPDHLKRILAYIKG